MGVWSKVEIAGSKPLYVGSFYRPPNPNVEPLEAQDQTLYHLTQKSPPNILFTGDFNMPSVSWAEDKYSIQPNIAYGIEVRPPNPNVEPLEAQDQTLYHLTQKSPPNILFTGDFNMPSVSWAEDNYSIQPNIAYGIEVNNKLLDIVNSHFLTQHVKQPTGGHNILDLVFTSNPDMITNLEIQCGMSDHE